MVNVNLHNVYKNNNNDTINRNVLNDYFEKFSDKEFTIDSINNTVNDFIMNIKDKEYKYTNPVYLFSENMIFEDYDDKTNKTGDKWEVDIGIDNYLINYKGEITETMLDIYDYKDEFFKVSEFFMKHIVIEKLINKTLQLLSSLKSIKTLRDVVDNMKVFEDKLKEQGLPNIIKPILELTDNFEDYETDSKEIFVYMFNNEGLYKLDDNVFEILNKLKHTIYFWIDNKDKLILGLNTKQMIDLIHYYNFITNKTNKHSDILYDVEKFHNIHDYRYSLITTLYLIPEHSLEVFTETLYNFITYDEILEYLCKEFIKMVEDTEKPLIFNMKYVSEMILNSNILYSQDNISNFKFNPISINHYNSIIFYKKKVFVIKDISTYYDIIDNPRLFSLEYKLLLMDDKNIKPYSNNDDFSNILHLTNDFRQILLTMKDVNNYITSKMIHEFEYGFSLDIGLMSFNRNINKDEDVKPSFKGRLRFYVIK